MTLTVSIWVLLGLIVAAFFAGWVDAVVGGGGIIQLPAVLIGLPSDTPVATVSGTNKISAIAGTSVASVSYVRSVGVQLASLIPLVVASFAGSTLGAHLVQLVPRKVFNPLVLATIIGIGIYTFRRPNLGLTQQLRHTGWAKTALLVTIGLVVGMWDGLLGPGTGSFLLIGLVALLGYGFLQASALAKLANFTTNLAALIVLGSAGHIMWSVGIPMAIANLTGGFTGARMAIKHGNGFVRKVFLVVIVVLGCRLAWQTFQEFA